MLAQAQINKGRLARLMTSERQQAAVPVHEVTNPFEEIQKHIDTICRRMNVDEGINARLRHCKRELIVHFPVKMDDGTLKISLVTGLSIIPAAGRPRVAFVTIPMLTWMRPEP